MTPLTRAAMRERPGTDPETGFGEVVVEEELGRAQIQKAAEPESGPPAEASHGEAQTWTDRAGCCFGRWRASLSVVAQNPEILTGEKVGRCSAG